MTMAEYVQYRTRMAARVRHIHGADGACVPEPVIKEIPLHDEIIKYCNSQWPVWKFRHARTDRKTTEEIGVEDFTIFIPGGKTVHIEVKAKGKKQTPEQLSWAKQLEMLGHRVFVVRSMDEFLEAVKL